MHDIGLNLDFSFLFVIPLELRMYIKHIFLDLLEKRIILLFSLFVAEPEHLMPRYLQTFKISGKWDSLFVILNSVFCLLSYFRKWGS